jgi:hypothetical protein
MRHRALPLLASILALAGCHKAPEPPQPLDGPIPAQICTETKKALDTLAAQGGTDFTDKGEATVEHAIWLTMSPDQRDSIARALAFRAGCASGRQSKEQEVTIRGEDGMVLMHRFVSTRTDVQSVLEGGG